MPPRVNRAASILKNTGWQELTFDAEPDVWQQHQHCDATLSDLRYYIYRRPYKPSSFKKEWKGDLLGNL